MNYELKIKKREKGFTLVELLVVIAIIGILSSVLLANFIGVRERARDATRKSDLKQIQSALELYRSDKGEYPTVISDTNSIFVPNYISKLPFDPLRTSNCPTYIFSSDKNKYTLFAALENNNDLEAVNPKPTPAYAPFGNTSTDNTTFSVTSGQCSGSVYNYWVNNP